MTRTSLHRSVPLVRRFLGANRGRTFAGVLGIAAALLLVLVLKAIFAGMETRLTAYIEASGADVIVAQQGVTTMHMTQSAIPSGRARAVARVKGVLAASGIVYRPSIAEDLIGQRSAPVAVVAGGPLPDLVSGGPPRSGSVVVDRALADRLRIGEGDSMRILGSPVRVAGQIDGTSGITGSFVFLSRSTLDTLLGVRAVDSYLLVRAMPGVRAEALAAWINREVGGVTATPRGRFAASERRVVGDMSTGIVRSMVGVGFVVGVAVAAMVAYSLTLAQRRDYGVLRALGLSARRSIVLAVAQVALLVVTGFALALAVELVLVWAIPAVSPSLVLTIRATDLAQAAAVGGVVAVAAAMVPLLQIVRVKPADVFRRHA